MNIATEPPVAPRQLTLASDGAPAGDTEGVSQPFHRLDWVPTRRPKIHDDYLVLGLIDDVNQRRDHPDPVGRRQVTAKHG